METAMNLFRLDGDVAFVTGAGSGIGQRIAIGLAEAGAAVACFDLEGSAGLQTTVDGIQELGRKAMAIRGDVTNGGALADAIGDVERTLGDLTVAVNSAGIANAVAAEEMSLERFQHLMKVNVEGVFLSCQAEGRAMLKHRRGSIINIASMSGSIVNRGLLQVHYNSSKAAVIHLSKSLAMEWCDRGIRVNSISPGYTRTLLVERLLATPEGQKVMPTWMGMTPAHVMGEVTDLQGAAVYLAGETSDFMTGNDLIIDGGYCAW